MVYPGDDSVFRKILSDGGVTVEFGAYTNTTAELGKREVLTPAPHTTGHTDP